MLSREELDRIRGMNVIQGTRLSWEEKEPYRDWLIRMASEGHLTNDEFAARMEWVDAARTDEELKVPFRDLPRMPLTPRPKPRKKRRPIYQWPASPYWTGGVAVWELGLAITSMVSGNVMGIVIGLIFFVVFGWLAARNYMNERDES